MRLRRRRALKPFLARGTGHPYGRRLLIFFSRTLSTMSFVRRRRTRFRDFSCIPWLPPAFGRRTRPFPLTRNRFAAALLVFIFGMARSFGVASRGPRPEAGRAFSCAGERGERGLWLKDAH